MKKEFQMKIKRDVYSYVWNKYKSEYDMKTLAEEILNTSLPTFFRAVKYNKKTSSPSISNTSPTWF